MCGSGGGGGGGNPLQSVANSTLGGLPIIGDYMRGQTAQDLAQQQGNAAQAQLDQQQADRDAATKIAQPTDLEMQQLNQAISTNTTDIKRKQQLLASADPAFIEAGRQAMTMLQGGNTSTANTAMQPIQQQRDQQRAQLINQLQSQLGPGWQNSTTGQQALQQFDAQSASTLNNARMSTLNQLMGYAGQSEQNGNTSSNVTQSQNIANTQGNMQARQIGAIEGTPITMAGAPFVANMQSDQYAIGTMTGAQQSMGQAYGYMGGTGTGAGDAKKFYKGGKVKGYADGGAIEGDDSVMSSLKGSSGGGGGGMSLASLAPLIAMIAAKGGRVPGTAAVKGDSPKNDKVLALLSPGEIVVDRETLKKSPKAIAKFVETAKRKKA